MQYPQLFLIAFALNFSVQAGELLPMHAQAVAKNVYAVITPARDFPNPENRGWNSNSAFVVTEAGVLLFDTGSSTEIGRTLQKTIASKTDKPVRWIINSHAHGDHWLGNGAFGEGVEKIMATREVANRIQAEGPNWVNNFKRMTNGISGDSTIVVPNTTLAGRTELTLGVTRFVIFPSGNSHSPGDLMLWLPDEKVLISGDVVYSDRMPSTNAADLRQWMSMLGELEQLQPRVVIPGHGNLTNVQGLARLRSLFATLWRAVETEYKAGKTDFEMVPAVSVALAGYRKEYPGLEEKLKRDISHVYLQVEAASF